MALHQSVDRLRRLLATPAAEGMLAPVRAAEQQAALDPEAPPPPDAGLLRGLASRITTPLLPDDYLHLLNPLWSARELRGVIVEVVPETETAATLVIRPGWGWHYNHKPGQYVGIGIPVKGKFHWRSYSISSAPKREGRTIAITVRAMPEGFLSSHLVKGLEPGTIIRLAEPNGDFVLPEPPPKKILFLVAGSGITPVMAMLRTLDRRETMPDVVVAYSSPTQERMIFRDEIVALSEKHENLSLHEQHTDSDGMLEMDDLDVGDDVVLGAERERPGQVLVVGEGLVGFGVRAVAGGEERVERPARAAGDPAADPARSVDCFVRQDCLPTT